MKISMSALPPRPAPMIATWVTPDAPAVRFCFDGLACEAGMCPSLVGFLVVSRRTGGEERRLSGESDCVFTARGAAGPAFSARP
jgi:hypothetical protein